MFPSITLPFFGKSSQNNIIPQWNSQNLLTHFAPSCILISSFVTQMNLFTTLFKSKHSPNSFIPIAFMPLVVFLCFPIVSLSLPYMETIELKVEMVALHEKKLRKCLSKVKGIEKVEVEASIQKVVVTGYAHRNKILKALRRVGLRAEFWSPQNEMLSAYASGTLMINNFSFL